MTALDARPEALFQMVEFLLGQLDLGNGGVNAMAEVVHASPQTGRPGVLFRHAHGIAVELVGQVGAQGGAFRQRQEAGVEVVNDARCVLFFLHL